jgi:deoxyribonuclease-4
MIVFATAGKPNSFSGKYPHDFPAYLEGFGLNGYEIQCGRGVNISQEVYDFFAGHNNLGVPIQLSLHAPYFISISSVEEEKRDKSIDYILQSAKAADRLGASRIVVHAGSCAKLSREIAMELAIGTLKKAREALDSHRYEHILICPETMGKVNQLGTVEEVLQLCEFDERMIPCIDFGHVYARNHGVVDYKDILDKAGKYKNLHIHFSKQEYSTGGEKKHLTFADTEFGPDFKPLLDEIAARKLEPFIVCESDGTQAEDAAVMAEYWREL